MKRSIVCFSLLALFVAAVSLAEIAYSNTLASKVDSVISQCDGADFETRYTLSCELKEYFENREVLNELFFSHKTIDNISRYISDLIIYSKYEDSENFERSLLLLTLCNECIYNAGIF